MPARAILLSFCFTAVFGLGGCLIIDELSNNDNNAPMVNAKEEIRWAGTYQGIFPCADCEGVATMLMLNPDRTYALRTRMLGKENIDKKRNGTFIWLPDNNHIRLLGKGQKQVFHVGKGFLELTQPDGRAIETDKKENFYLEKSN